MAVKIGIDADVSGLKRGMQDIQNEIDKTQQGFSSLGKAQMGTMKMDIDPRSTKAAMDFIDDLKKGMEKTGQAGAKLSAVKFNTENAKQYQKILFEVQKNLSSINRSSFGRDVFNRARGTEQDKANPLDWDWGKMYPGDERQAEQARRRFMSKLVYGSKYEEPKPPTGESPSWKGAAGGGGSGGGSSSDAKSGGFLGSAWGAIKSGVGFGLGLAGIQSIGQVISGGLSREASKRESLDTLFKTSNESWVPLETSIKGLSDALMLTEEQAAKLATEYMRVANVTGDFTKSLEVSGQFGRGFGLDPGQAAQTFGRASAVGYGADRNSQREFAGLLANTITSSHMVGRSEQVMGDMVGQLQKIADEQGRTLSQTEMEGFARTLSGIYGSSPAMSGRGASNVLGGFSALGSGGSEANQLFLWQAYSHSMPQSRQSHIGLQKFMGADIFDEVAPGMTKLQAMWGELQKYAEPFIRGGTKREDALAYVMNQLQPSISMQKGTSMVRAMDAVGQEDFGKFAPWVQSKTGKNFEDVAPGAWKSLAAMFNDQSPDTWRKVAKQYAESPLISPDNAKDLKEAIQKFDEGNQSALQSILPKIVATTGMPETQADRDRDAQAKLTDALTDLTKPVKDLKTIIEEKLTPAISSLAGFAQRIADVFSPKPEPGQAPETGIDSVTGTFFRGGAEAYDAMGWARPDQYLDDVHKLILDPISDKLKGGWDKAKNSTFGRGVRSLGENIRESAGWIGDHVIGKAGATMGAGDYPGEGLQLPRQEGLEQGSSDGLAPTNEKWKRGIKPGLVGRADEILAHFRSKGMDVRVVQGFRTQEQQDRLWAKGRTAPGPKVTWTRNSRHQSGRALDFGLFRDGKYVQEPPQEFINELARLERERGLQWGVLDKKGRQKDPLHTEISEQLANEDYKPKVASMPKRQLPIESAFPITSGFGVGGRDGDQNAVTLLPSEKGKKASFYKNLLPYALEASKKTGISPELIIAQAAQETGFGSHVHDNNFFNLTAGKSWTGKTRVRNDRDANGRPVKHVFRAYDTAQEAFDDYAKMIQAQWPKAMGAKDVESFDAGLAAGVKGRWAEDRNYGEHIGDRLREMKLKKTDAPQQGLAKEAPQIRLPEPMAKAPSIPEMNAPKTPEKLDSLMASNSLQDPLNVRLSGQQEVRFILENDRGDVLHERNVPLVSEPSLHGSAGAHAFGERRFYNAGNAYR